MSRYYGYNNYVEDDFQPRRSTEIYSLRREGNLDAARQLAENLINNGQGDYDVWKAYAWTLIDICKHCKNNGDTQRAIELANNLTSYSKRIFEPKIADDEFADTLVRNIRRMSLSVNPYYAQIQEAKECVTNGNNDRAWQIMNQLSANGNLPNEAHEDYGWVIYRCLRDHLQSLSSEQVRSLLRDYIVLNNERPSLLHSQILNFALNYSRKDSNFKLISFLELWKPENLRNEDFEDSKGDDGKTIPCLMSRIARAIVNYPVDDIKVFINIVTLRKDDFIEMLQEQYFWQIYHSTEGGVSNTTWALFDQYLDIFSESQSSEAKSKVLGLAERVMKDENTYRFYTFFKQWNPEKLRQVDWQEEKGENGENYKPLAIKSIKKAKDAMGNLPVDQIGDLQWLINLYDNAIAKFPDDDWNIRSKALLLLQMGQLEEAKSIYKDLCLKMGDKYYIWQEFANCWEENEIKIALLCKAISLEKNEDFIGKIRLELAKQLFKVGKVGFALIEVNKYKEHYTQKGWRIDPEVDSLLSACQSSDTNQKLNGSIYPEYIHKAEEIAYADIPYMDMVHIDSWKNNEGKELLSFSDGGDIELIINKRRFTALCNSHKGQVWKMKLYKEVINETIPAAHPWQQSTNKVSFKYSPLVVTTSDMEDWCCLPIGYGYIQHVNTEKKVYHIYPNDSCLVYVHYDEQTLQAGDFVTFRYYKKQVKEELKTFICSISKCETEDAIGHFKSRIVAVDDVNNSKRLFHFVLGPRKISGILYFDQTDLRPTVGDCIKIYYYVRKTEDKKNPGHEKKIIEVLKAIPSTEVNAELIKNVSGDLVLKYRAGYDYGEPDFAFVGDYYVHRSILDKYDIKEDCHVTGRVVYSGDGKWKVFELKEE